MKFSRKQLQIKLQGTSIRQNLNFTRKEHLEEVYDVEFTEMTDEEIRDVRLKYDGKNVYVCSEETYNKITEMLEKENVSNDNIAQESKEVIDDLNKRIVELDNKLNIEKHSNDALKNQVNEHIMYIENLENEKTRLNEQIHQYKNNQNDMKFAFDKIEEKMQNQIDDLRRDKNEKYDENKNLVKENRIVREIAIEQKKIIESLQNRSKIDVLFGLNKVDTRVVELPPSTKSSEAITTYVVGVKDNE